MKVLIIEDDPQILEAVTLTFQIRWPEVDLVSSQLGERGIEMVETERPDIVILDLGLPDMSGYDVLKQIRLFSDVTILILTVRAEEVDIIKGLEWGADEYMTKPFRQLELLARVKALMRRGTSLNEDATLVCGQLSFNPASLLLLVRGKEVAVTRTEGLILQKLMRNAGRAVGYSSLAEVVWGPDCSEGTQNLKVHMRRLREKIETDPGQPQVLLTKVGAGYLIANPKP